MERKIYNGRYKIIGKIGSGGMADVFQAEDIELGRKVAVKVLHTQFAQDENFIARFKREAQSAARLTHPNIVSIYDVGQEDGTYFIVMEYVAGTTLKQIIQRDAPLPTDKIIHIATQIGNAMEFAHTHEIIHRDIKPQNVIITESGEIKVTDFGIARLGSSSTMTRTGAILGTAHYISPEQAQGGIVGPTSDIYSLGVVMYEMATGELPFRGENPVAVALKHINDTALPPKSVFNGIPDSLEAIIMKAMSKNPQDRYASAKEMNEDLQRALDGQPIKIMATSPVTSKEPNDVSQTMISSQPLQQNGPRKKKKWVTPVIIIGLFLLGLSSGALAYYFLTPKTIVVPDLKNKTLSEAQRIVEKADLKLKIDKEVYNEKVKPGQIISQDPDAGEKIRKGGTIKVVLSKGLQTIKVPNLIGKTEDEARGLLKKAGLVMGNIESTYSDTAKENTIVSQSPKSDVKVEKGSTVDVTISRGSESLDVPEVVGKTESEAKSILENVGFFVSSFEDYSTTVAVNHVIRQSPEAGAKASAGSTITIAISKGPEQVTLDGAEIIGRTKDEARSWLENNGLVVTVVEVGELPPTQPSNHVYDVNPAAGTTVNKGSSVTIYVEP